MYGHGPPGKHRREEVPIPEGDSLRGVRIRVRVTMRMRVRVRVSVRVR